MASEGWEIVGKLAVGAVVLGALGTGAKLGYDAIYEAGEKSGMRKQEKVLEDSGRLIPEFNCMRYAHNTKNADGLPITRFYGVEGCQGTEFRYVLSREANADQTVTIAGQTLTVGKNEASFYKNEAYFSAPSLEASMNVKGGNALTTFKDARATFERDSGYVDGSYISSGLKVTLDRKVAEDWKTTTSTFKVSK